MISKIIRTAIGLPLITVSLPLIFIMLCVLLTIEKLEGGEPNESWSEFFWLVLAIPGQFLSNVWSN